MAERTSRNILAALLIVAGAILVAVSPVSADGESPSCVDVSFDFDDLGQGPLTKNNTTLGPVTVALGAGTYNVVLTGSDPTHAPGQFVDQTHESWFVVTNGGYTSPITPDIPEADSAVQIVDSAVTLSAATQITAVWAGAAPSFDSVHPRVLFQCTDPVIPLGSTIPDTTVAPTTTPTTVATTLAPTTTTTAAPTTTTTATTVVDTVPATTAAPTTVAAVTTTTAGSVNNNGTVRTTTAVTAAAQTDEDDDNPELGSDDEELAETGVNLTLALTGISLIAAGIGMVIWGQAADMRKQRLAYARR